MLTHTSTSPGNRGLPALVLLALLTLTACSSDTSPQIAPAPPNTARIISSFPNKGEFATQSKLITQAIDLAIEQRKGNLAGWSIEHVSLDGGSDETGDWTAQIERANALRAASDPSAIAYIGPYNSGAAKVSLPITNKAGLLQLSPTVTWPGLTLPGWDAGEPGAYYPSGVRHFVRMMPHDGAQAQAAAAWAAQLGATTAYVVHDESTYSAGLARSFADAASDYGLGIAGEATFAVVESNSLAGAIRAAGADLLFYAPSSIAQALDLMSALDDVDLTAGVIMSDVALNGSVAQAASASAIRFRAIFNGIDPMPDTSRWAEFSAAFRGRFGPEPGQFAGNAYDLTNLVLDALLEAGALDRASISRSVMSARFRSGVTGTITLDDSGNREQWRMSGYHAVDGRFVMEQILADTP